MSGTQQPQPDGLSKKVNSTVLGDFGRKVRDEPWHYIFKHRLFITKDGVAAEPLVKWLRTRYVKSRTGHRYRVATYKAKDGKRYVDYVLLETLSDNDRVEMKLRGWIFQKEKVMRGDRLPRKKLTREQRKQLKALIEKTEAEFYESIMRSE
jgi:hypothetical protein